MSVTSRYVHDDVLQFRYTSITECCQWCKLTALTLHCNIHCNIQCIHCTTWLCTIIYIIIIYIIIFIAIYTIIYIELYSTIYITIYIAHWKIQHNIHHNIHCKINSNRFYLVIYYIFIKGALIEVLLLKWQICLYFYKCTCYIYIVSEMVLVSCN